MGIQHRNDSLKEQNGVGTVIDPVARVGIQSMEKKVTQQGDLLPQLVHIVQVLSSTSTISALITDELALESSSVFPVFPAGAFSKGKYNKNQIVLDPSDNNLYRVTASVVPDTDFYPHMDTSNSYYKVISSEASTEPDGSLENPYPFILGMAVVENNYYSYQNHIYRVVEGGTKDACIIAPGNDTGATVWTLVN
jgi:hypothetical protein